VRHLASLHGSESTTDTGLLGESGCAGHSGELGAIRSVGRSWVGEADGDDDGGTRLAVGVQER
jgi:hypothetical protein